MVEILDSDTLLCSPCQNHNHEFKEKMLMDPPVEWLAASGKDRKKPRTKEPNSAIQL